MKKSLLFFLSAIIVLSSCNKKDDDYAFDKSPDERLNESLAKYQSILTTAPYGWKARIAVDNGNGGFYSFYLKFNDSNRVSMVSDFDSASAVTYKSSSYRIREQQQPTLIFDTYSYIHVLADPNENAVVTSNVNGGPVGQGLLSDFEFIIDKDKITNDSIKLKGKVNGAALTLVRATQDEANVYTSNGWALSAKFFTKYLLTYYKLLNIGGTNYDMYVDNQTRTITFSWINAAGDYVSETTRFYNTLDGIYLDKPLVNGSTTISSLIPAGWDNTTKTYNITSDGVAGTIKETIKPQKIDVDAPQRWMDYATNQGGYWASWDGFHINGVDDSLKLHSLPNYYQLIYYPLFDPSGYDLFAPLFYDGLYYGAAPVMTVAGTGIAKFTSAGNYGTYPSSGPARTTRTLLYSTTGFYFVQTSESSFDMVSAKDGKAWLTWFF